MKPTPAPATDEQRFAVILGELAENIDRYRKREAFILDGNKKLCNENEKLKDELAFSRRECATLKKQVADLRRFTLETMEARDKAKHERNEHKARVDDLAQQLAVTECQLEDARKQLKRYEGGSK